MWELDCEESWVPKNWCFWIVVLEKTLESPLDCKEIQLVHLKGDQYWVFIGRTDAKAETPIFWPPHAKSWLIGKDSDAGRDWGQEKNGVDRGWDGWMASLTRWTWVWVNSGSWWLTGRPGVLQFMESQRVGHNCVTELNWTEYSIIYMYHSFFIHSYVDGPLDSFHVLAIVNRAAMNFRVHVSFWIMIFSGYMPSSWISGSYGNFIPNFLRNLHTVLHSAVSVYIFTISERGFPGGASDKQPPWQFKRCQLDPWTRKIPRRRVWQPTPVFLSGEHLMDRGA